MPLTSERIRSEAFTEDLTPYQEAAQQMYPGGRLRRVVRAFDRIFHRGLVEMTDRRNAMILVDRAQRARIDAQRATDMGRQLLPTEPGQRSMREALLADTYRQIDAGENVAPGLVAHHEGLVQEERLQRAQAAEAVRSNPFQPDMTGVLPPDGLIDPDAAAAHQQPPHDLPQ